ncbi:hypothetical protein PAPYR_7979 [Paratrimastix pyriformis]|uniref:Uncharacterized protein n=1 Tax=Paratrimastix pyriformis TaxID=342808 RepID=A0ABQ8UFN0_9EUKA|nr:hypothetical protein PAPYR_7979 [Paratrimastix pyriformis]
MWVVTHPKSTPRKQLATQPISMPSDLSQSLLRPLLRRAPLLAFFRLKPRVVRGHDKKGVYSPAPAPTVAKISRTRHPLLDAQIEKALRGEVLDEEEIKDLCEKVISLLIWESNVKASAFKVFTEKHATSLSLATTLVAITGLDDRPSIDSPPSSPALPCSTAPSLPPLVE